MIGQGDLDQMAALIQARLGGLTEPVTVLYRQYASSEAVAYGPLAAFLEEFREGTFFEQALLARHEPRVLRGDRLIRIATSLLAIQPTAHSTIVRASGEVWRIAPHDAAIRGGPGSPWWLLHTRRLPT